MNLRAQFIVGIGVLSLAAGSTHARSNPPAIAFVGVTVLAMTDGADAPEEQTVLVRGGRIVAVGPSDRVKVPRDAMVIPAKGRFLMPGLADMHAHINTRDDLTLYLANGVTTVRSMWGEAPVLGLREAVRAGRVEGPRIIVGGRIVDGKSPIHFGTVEAISPADGRRAVADQKAAGYDFVKIYAHLDVPTFDAIAAEAKARKIPFGGHVPDAVPTDHAMRSGMASIEHLTGMGKAIATGPLPIDTGSVFNPEALKTVAAVGRGEIAPGSLQDPARLAAIARTAADTRTASVPTLALIDAYMASADWVRQSARRPEMQYMSPGVLGLWRALDPLFLSRSEEVGRGFGLLRANMFAQVKALHDAGALLLAGTDAPNPYVFTGFDLALEIARLHEAGLSRDEALAAATRNPALFLGRAGKMGIVAPGAMADLLLLEADPRRDLGALRAIAGVMHQGRWKDRAALDAMLADIATRNRQWAERVAALPPLPTDLESSATVSTFRLMRGTTDVGTARLAVRKTDSGRIVLFQQVEDGALRTDDLLFDMSGRLIAYVQQAGGIPKDLSAETAGRMLVTRTPADAYTVAPYLAEPTPLQAAVAGAGSVQVGPASVEKLPSEIILGHFGWLGATPVAIGTSGGKQRVWLGARFFADAPMQYEQGGKGLRYVRVE